MEQSQELQRVSNPRAGPQDPSHGFPVVVTASFASPADAEQALPRIRDVMRTVAERMTADGWPSEEEWKSLLPAWLLEQFHYFTREELEAFLASGHDRSEIGWHYGSWLDAMHERGWEWWDAEQHGSKILLTVLVDGHPYSIGGLRFLLQAAGAKEIAEE